MSQPLQDPEQTVRVLQIITVSLVAGVLLFGGIAVFGLGALDGPPEGFVVSAVGAVVAGGAFVLHLIIPAAIARQAGTAPAWGLYGMYLTKTIVGLAILEGAAFLNIIATIIEHNGWSLAIAGGLVFWMLALFPTKTRVAHWVEVHQMLHSSP